MNPQVFKVITLSGKKNSGKNLAGDILVNNFGFAQTSFANYLKELCVDILNNMGCPTTMEDLNDREKKEEFIRDANGDKFLFHNNHVKDGYMTRRQFMQILGTEGLRSTIHYDIWVIPVIEFIKRCYTDPLRRFNGVCITDARFPNEISSVKEACKDLGREIDFIDVNIIRPSVDTNDLHASENALNKHEFEVGILNDGTIDEFSKKIHKLATGEWKLEKTNHDIKERHANHWMRKYE